MSGIGRDANIHFELVGEISGIEAIAVGGQIRELGRLKTRYGEGRWRKMKGNVRIRLPSGRLRLAESHWYEAHGLGRKEPKRKRYRN